MHSASAPARPQRENTHARPSAPTVMSPTRQRGLLPAEPDEPESVTRSLSKTTTPPQ